MTVIPVYTEEIYIGPEYLDTFRHVNNTWHVHWMQEVATTHSALNGWDAERYLAEGIGWFVRQHTINYHHQILEGDTILIDTWVSQMKHVTSVRQYRIRRKTDNLVLATATTRWGLVNLKTGRPQKISPELMECFLEMGEVLPDEMKS